MPTGLDGSLTGLDGCLTGLDGCLTGLDGGTQKAIGRSGQTILRNEEKIWPLFLRQFSGNNSFWEN